MRRALGLLHPDVAATIASLGAGVAPYAVYTPAGSEAALRELLPPGFRLLLQSHGDLGERLTQATADLLAQGHAGAVLVNSDGPTLPALDPARRRRRRAEVATMWC